MMKKRQKRKLRPSISAYFLYDFLIGRIFLGRHKASTTHRLNNDIQKIIFACYRACFYETKKLISPPGGANIY